MKKLLILAGLFLLPLFAFSQVNPTTEQDADAVEQIKSIIYNSRKQLGYKDIPSPSSSPYPLRRKFFSTGKIKYELQKSGLMDVLQNNPEILNEVANYIIDTRPNRNDFETLLAIGIKPIEAAIRINDERSIEEALSHHQITYAHYYIGEPYVTSHILITYVPVKTSQQEINEIKERVNKLRTKKQIRKIKVNKIIENFGNKLGDMIEPISPSFDNMGKGYSHW